jgi:hypothetical protein
MQPKRHDCRNSRCDTAPRGPCGTGSSWVAFWSESEPWSLMDRRKASSVVSTDLNMRRFERQMLRAAAMIVIAVVGELVSGMCFGLPRIYGLFLRRLSSGEYPPLGYDSFHTVSFRFQNLLLLATYVADIAAA